MNDSAVCRFCAAPIVAADCPDAICPDCGEFVTLAATQNTPWLRRCLAQPSRLMEERHLAIIRFVLAYRHAAIDTAQNGCMMELAEG